MCIDLSAITDPQFNADMDFAAAMQYAASSVRELLAEDLDLTSPELRQTLAKKAEQVRHPCPSEVHVHRLVHLMVDIVDVALEPIGIVSE